MKYTIYKKVRFEASHKLLGLPDTHQCSRLHGHSYLVEVWCSSTILNKVGMVADFNDISSVVKSLDHQDLNSIVDFNPTAERLAEYLFYALSTNMIEKVRVWETETS